MKITQKELLEDLVKRTEKHLNAAQQFLELPLEKLQQKPSEKAWSILECIEHLNLYGDFYLPEIAQQMKNSTLGAEAVFKSGWLGNYFANAMLPRRTKPNNMNTFKDKNPNGSTLGLEVLHRFIEQQKTTLNLLHQAQTVNLTKIKTGITISSWIRLRLGDTFRVVIYHNYRHIVQAQKLV
jgi:hypothetical protein